MNVRTQVVILAAFAILVITSKSIALEVDDDLKIKGTSPWIDVTHPDYGADPNDNLSDTAAVQAAIDALPADGGVIFFPKGTYIINGLSCTNAGTVVFSGMGNSTVLTRTSAQAILASSEPNSIVIIQSLTIDGANLAAPGIGISHASLVRLENLNIKSCGIPGYEVGHRGAIDGVYISNTETVIVKSCIFEDCERDGLKGIGIKHLNVQQSQFMNIGRLGISNETIYNYYPLSSQITGNHFESCGTGGIHTETTFAYPVCEISFIGNIIKNCCNDSWMEHPYGIVAGNNTRGIISGNTVLNCGTLENDASGIVAGNIGGGLVISGNTIDSTGRNGIAVSDVNDNKVTISANMIQNAGEVGIIAYMAPNVTITGNTIFDSQREGIVIDLSSFSVISANIVRDNSKAGINQFSGIKSRLSFQHIIIGNNINGSNHKYGYESDNNNYSIQFSGNNIYIFNTDWFSGAYGMGLGTIAGTRKEFSGTASPATGSWNKGDKIMNTNPTPGSYDGWICVTSGTPGTWKGFGLIEQ